jgi:hypothetical protein
MVQPSVHFPVAIDKIPSLSKLLSGISMCVRPGINVCEGFVRIGGDVMFADTGAPASRQF